MRLRLRFGDEATITILLEWPAASRAISSVVLDFYNRLDNTDPLSSHSTNTTKRDTIESVEAVYYYVS